MSAARPRLSEPRGLAHPTVAEELIALLNGTLTARGRQLSFGPNDRGCTPLTAVLVSWPEPDRGCPGLARRVSSRATGLYARAGTPDIVIAVGQSAAAAVAGGMHGFVPTLTSFVGRDEALAEVAALLERHRLVTVTGPGGSGKTRLAGQVARQVAGRFADGVWLAELAPVRDPAQVPAVLAAVLGVREQPGEPAAETLARVLAEQQLLLVLDSCEHVIGAAAELCAGLLPACDEVRVLATSREPLRVAGEARYRLPPLTLPDPDDAAGAAGSEAVALFADRARQADARFALDSQAELAVARLVSRLDGMPLAIELAAARVEALGVTQLLDRLDDRFDLLTTGDRLAAGRHRSLAATVEWSYRLLKEAERRVFRAVSVFPGPFTLAGAEAVAGENAGPAVLRMVDCSLVVPPRAGPDGRSRYVVLETLRGYGNRLLAEEGEEAGVAAALAGYALGVAEQAAAGLETGTGELAAGRWLDAEDATLRHVLTWTLKHDPAAALRLIVAVAPWWLQRGRLTGDYPRLLEAAGHAEPGSDTWCAAQFWLGMMALSAADPAGALGHFTAIRDGVADRPSRALADAMASRSFALAILGLLADATDDGHRALALARELGYPGGQVQALGSLGFAAYYAGDFDDAVRLARQAGQIPADLPGSTAHASNEILTSALIEAGDLAAAERGGAACLARARAAGDLPNQARGLLDLADLDLRAGRVDDAAAHLRESLQVAARSGDLTAEFNGLDWCGYLCAATGRHAEAVTVWAARDALRRLTALPDPAIVIRRRHEPLRRAREALGEDRARAAEDRGAAMSRAAATEYALLLTAAEPGPGAPPAALAGLSARERELVILVAQGRTDAQIAAQLFISPRTVHSHLDRIRDKTGARRRADLTRLALTAGLV